MNNVMRFQRDTTALLLSLQESELHCQPHAATAAAGVGAGAPAAAAAANGCPLPPALTTAPADVSQFCKPVIQGTDGSVVHEQASEPVSCGADYAQALKALDPYGRIPPQRNMPNSNCINL